MHWAVPLGFFLGMGEMANNSSSLSAAAWAWAGGGGTTRGKALVGRGDRPGKSSMGGSVGVGTCSSADGVDGAAAAATTAADDGSSLLLLTTAAASTAAAGMVESFMMAMADGGWRAMTIDRLRKQRA